MRRLLDSLYNAAGYTAALFLVGTLLMVLTGILDRILPFRLLRGSDAYAGYCMAASAFLALAYTFKRNEHIRVTLLLNSARPGLRRGLEMWSLFAALLLSVLFGYYSVRLAWQSYAFNDVSTMIDASPLWIPQIGMAVGTVVLAIAFADELVLQLRGSRHANRTDGEMLRSE